MKEYETVHLPARLIICDDTEVNSLVEELKTSIEERGLMNPITVQALNTSPPSFKVIAGKKRLKACQLLGITDIPCRITTGDENEIRLITIDENLKRENLPWWEIVDLVSKHHEVRQAQLGIAKGGRRPTGTEKTGWSTRDTAKELSLSLGFVSEAIMLQKAVEQDPSLRNIKDRDTATRLVRVAAKRMDAETLAELPVDFETNQVYNGPSAEILAKFEGHSFDACFTDPPWLKYIDSKLVRDNETLPVFKQIFRVLRADSFLYMFVGFEDFYSYSRELPRLGFTVSKTPLIWVKKELRVVDDIAQLHGVVLSQGARSWEYSRDFELILLAAKGSPALVESVQQSSIKVFPPLAPVTLTHPNEKPVALLKNLLNDFSHEGSIILDPFAGSGAHLQACKEEKRRYIGIERDRKFYEQIVARLRGGKK